MQRKSGRWSPDYSSPDRQAEDITPLGYRFVPEKCVLPEVDPNPDQAITRVMNHFYDPIHDVALNSGCAVFSYNGVCSKSIDWALRLRQQLRHITCRQHKSAQPLHLR